MEPLTSRLAKEWARSATDFLQPTFGHHQSRPPITLSLSVLQMSEWAKYGIGRPRVRPGQPPIWANQLKLALVARTSPLRGSSGDQRPNGRFSRPIGQVGQPPPSPIWCLLWPVGWCRRGLECGMCQFPGFMPIRCSIVYHRVPASNKHQNLWRSVSTKGINMVILHKNRYVGA
jgi:hypothetical protein